MQLYMYIQYIFNYILFIYIFFFVAILFRFAFTTCVVWVCVYCSPTNNEFPYYLSDIQHHESGSSRTPGLLQGAGE